MIGNKHQQRVWIGILAVGLDGSDLFSIGARTAAKQSLYPAHKEHLKRRHQRGRAGAVEHFIQRSLGQVELEQPKIARVGSDQMLKNGVAAALAKKRLVAHQHIRRL